VFVCVSVCVFVVDLLITRTSISYIVIYREIKKEHYTNEETPVKFNYL